MYPQAQTLTLSSVGQITLPKSIRKLLGLEAGEKLAVAVNKTQKTITLKKQPTLDEIMNELDKIDAEYPTPEPDPKYRNMTVGEIALSRIHEVKEDTWV